MVRESKGNRRYTADHGAKDDIVAKRMQERQTSRARESEDKA